MADEPQPPTDARPGEAPSPDAQVAALQAEVASWRSQALRARADYDNLQRRIARDAAVDRERNKARVLEAFLPILELAHMAAHQAESHPGPMAEGVAMLAREFDRMVAREGLATLGAVGEPVDHARHEVLASEPAAGVAPGHVARVVQPGYMLGDKVLRFAKVTVAARESAAGAESAALPEGNP